MRFSTTFIALLAAAPALAAPVHYRGSRNAQHTHEERDLEERAPEPAPRKVGATKAFGHFAGSVASQYLNNSKRAHRGGDHSGGNNSKRSPPPSPRPPTPGPPAPRPPTPRPPTPGPSTPRPPTPIPPAPRPPTPRPPTPGPPSPRPPTPGPPTPPPRPPTPGPQSPANNAQKKPKGKRSPSPRGGRRGRGDSGPYGGQSQEVSQRDFEEIEARAEKSHGRTLSQLIEAYRRRHLSERDLGEFAEEIGARSFDEPVDIDLMIRELGSSEEDGLYF